MESAELCVASLVSAMSNGLFGNAGSAATLPDRTAKQPFKRVSMFFVSRRS